MLTLRAAAARAGTFRLHDVSVDVPSGGYAVVIGPAGAGKTTLLETIAGLVPLTSGAILLDGRDLRGVPPERRDVGLVYQHAHLFPHLSVDENVAYGAADADAVRELRERLGIGALAHRRVASLSGGERQLVALARALARRPRLLLLDEPYGALDPLRRAEVRRTVRALHGAWGLTTMHVTHDLAEARQLGDLVVLLDAGTVLQAGEPAAVFHRPASPRAAALLGVENVLAGTVRVDATGTPTVAFTQGALVLRAKADADGAPGAMRDGAAVHAAIRAEEIVLCREEAGAASAPNIVNAIVREVALAGPLTYVTVDVGGVSLVAALLAPAAERLALHEGERVRASITPRAVHLC